VRSAKRRTAFPEGEGCLPGRYDHRGVSGGRGRLGDYLTLLPAARTSRPPSIVWKNGRPSGNGDDEGKVDGLPLEKGEGVRIGLVFGHLPDDREPQPQEPPWCSAVLRESSPDGEPSAPPDRPRD